MDYMRKLLGLDIKELMKYKDLLFLLVKEKLVVTYSQTILGFAWYFISPLLTALVYSVIFGNFAAIPTDGVPTILFYLSGTILWSFFNSTFQSISNVLSVNAGIMSKVYFPRIIPPLATLLSSFVNFSIQFLVFILFYLYFWMRGEIMPNVLIWTSPIYISLLAILAFGFGLWVAAFSVKYKDLRPLVNFFILTLMFITPVLYPISIIPDKYRYVANLNPLVNIFEGFREGWFGLYTTNYTSMIYMVVLTFSILALGIRAYNKTAQTFIDTI